MRHCVAEIQEVDFDFYAIDPHFFVLNTTQCYNAANNAAFRERSIQGLQALCMGLGKNPSIRYQATSPLCHALAKNMAELTAVRAVSASSASMLLILDRRFDLLSPLLHQFTYQAMIHDLIGIADNKGEMHKVLLFFNFADP